MAGIFCLAKRLWLYTTLWDLFEWFLKSQEENIMGRRSKEENEFNEKLGYLIIVVVVVIPAMFIVAIVVAMYVAGP